MTRPATQLRSRPLVRRLATGLVAGGVALVAAEPAQAVNTCRFQTSVTSTDGAFHWADCRTSPPNATYEYLAYVGCWANRQPALVERTGGVWLRTNVGGWSKAYCRYDEIRQYYGVHRR
jgi:hypothetical protein